MATFQLAAKWAPMGLEGSIFIDLPRKLTHEELERESVGLDLLARPTARAGVRGPALRL